jgi:teichuronic acid biosynthesis glycosyltransferase TuaG
LCILIYTQLYLRIGGSLPVPKVSVIMPAYNAEKFIAHSIESVMCQTFSDWELVVVDDGSTDRTADVVKQYSNRDPKVKYVYQQNGRQGNARNTGIRYSSSEFTAFLDADDLWVPEKLALQLPYLESGKADLVFSNYISFTRDISGGEVIKCPCGIFDQREFFELLSLRNMIGIQTVVVRKSSLLSVNLFSEELNLQNAEDYHLWLKLCVSGSRFYGIERSLAFYRRHENQATFGDATAYRQALNAVLDLYRNPPQYTAMFQITRSILSFWYRRGILLSSKMGLNKEILFNEYCDVVGAKSMSFISKTFERMPAWLLRPCLKVVMH